MVQELTIEQARANAANFMYIFASEDFLNAIPSKYAKEIRRKQANENKLIKLSAERYGGTREEYAAAIREGFIETYNCTPAEALITLAQGGEVAGKDWSEGVYGVGSLSSKFSGTDITVDPKTGAMSNNGVAMTSTNIVYAEVKGQTMAYQIFATDAATGKVYMSQYNKTLKKYYAQTYTTSDGKKYNAYGTAVGNKDAGTVWETIFLSLQTFVDWLISLFGGTTNTEQLTADNTLPNQKTDGFVYQSGFGEAGTILLLLAGGGALIASGALKKTTK